VIEVSTTESFANKIGVWTVAEQADRHRSTRRRTSPSARSFSLARAGVRSDDERAVGPETRAFQTGAQPVACRLRRGGGGGVQLGKLSDG